MNFEDGDMLSLTDESLNELAECLTKIFQREKIPQEAVSVEINLNVDKLKSIPETPRLTLLIENENSSNELNYKLSLLRKQPRLSLGSCYWSERHQAWLCPR
jgi:hypothetical protein